MSLDKFMKKTRSVVLMIDMNNMIYRTLATAYKNDPFDDKFVLWKSMMVERVFNNIIKFKADSCIIAIDDKNYWRKDIYPGYKQHRKSAREKSPIDFDLFFPVMKEFLKQMEDAFDNIHFLKVHKCEADDIIAVLTTERFQNKKIICISNDSDLKQLYKYKNYQQYNPIKDELFNPVNSQRDLHIKILTGDKSDSIPNIYTRCGPKSAETLLDEGLEHVFKKGKYIKIKGVTQHIKGNEIKSKYILNKQLIDFDMIPFNIKKRILDVYDSNNINKYNGRKIYKFLLENELMGVIENLEKNSKILMNLC